MGRIQDLRMGAMSLKYKGEDLGHTKGGLTFKLDRNFEGMTVDQYGDTLVDLILQGQKATIEVNLAEPSVAKLNLVIPEGNDTVGATGEIMTFGTDAGYSLRNGGSGALGGGGAGLLVCHPLNKAITDDSEDIQIYMAASSEPIELPYKVKEQRVYKVTFTAFVDETRANGRRLGHVGPLAIS